MRTIGFWQRQNLELPWTNSDETKLNFGSDRFWNCLELIPMSCSWILTKPEAVIVVEKFRWDAIEFWLRHGLELS